MIIMLLMKKILKKIKSRMGMLVMKKKNGEEEKNDSEVKNEEGKN